MNDPEKILYLGGKVFLIIFFCNLLFVGLYYILDKISGTNPKNKGINDLITFWIAILPSIVIAAILTNKIL